VGQDLVDAVCEHLNLAEKDYFSCSYRDSHGERVSCSRCCSLSCSSSSSHVVVVVVVVVIVVVVVTVVIVGNSFRFPQQSRRMG